MKKVIAHLSCFVICLLIIFAGYSKDFILGCAHDIKNIIFNTFKLDFSEVERQIDKLERDSSELLSYHGLFMDVNSAKENVLGTRVVVKDSDTIIKADSGSLISYSERLIDEEEIRQIADQVDLLNTVADENGAHFLYLAAPSKELFETPPVNINDFTAQNYFRYMEELRARDISLVDFSDVLKEQLSSPQGYFITDHHWTPYSGILAAKVICEELGERYGFEYDQSLFAEENLNIVNYKDYFLGSSGKKVGTLFTWHGADDFELIKPKYATLFSEEQPAKNSVREGDFEETLLFMNNLSKKDLYHLNPYATYSGGDFRLQIFKNKLNTNGIKVLMIRDSYADVVAPFLALQVEELHLCDIRNYEYYVGERLNLTEYINQLQPDYVLVLYNSVYEIEDSAGRYEFITE